MIGISHDDPLVTDESEFRYDAWATIDREVKLEGEIGRKTIAGGRYAVFLHAGPYEGFQKTYDQIFMAWLPGSGEKLREEPCFEVAELPACKMMVFQGPPVEDKDFEQAISSLWDVMKSYKEETYGFAWADDDGRLFADGEA